MQSKVAKNTANCRLFTVKKLENYTALKQLLQQQLLAALNFWGTGIVPAHFAISQSIPLHRISNDTGVIYRSAIALKLSPLLQQKAIDIANQLTASLLTISDANANQQGLQFSLEVISPGWINFRISDRNLAIWLQHLIDVLPQERKTAEVQVKPLPSNPLLDNLFSLQYIHARCCSLLGEANRQGFIELRYLDLKTARIQLAQPNPIPWLKDGQEDMHLRLVHPAEKVLIAHILDGLDRMSSQSQSNLLKLGSALRLAFEQFYSDCRIWGEVKTQQPKLAIARLGLVALTQALLRQLLQDHLNVSAITEL